MGAAEHSKIMVPGYGLMAARAGLVACRSCQLLCKQPLDGTDVLWTCPRCGAGLHPRKPQSLGRTWALIIAALILYVPANVLPITHTTSLGRDQSDTILSGVIYFLNTGSWHIALIIFIASIIVPVVKLLVLSYLLISVHARSRKWPAVRTLLYRITETIGRWSMVDIYVLTVLVAMVRLDFLASVQAGPGAVFFGAVVVLTMLAARSFDPRLIWDAAENGP